MTDAQREFLAIAIFAFTYLLISGRRLRCCAEPTRRGPPGCGVDGGNRRADPEQAYRAVDYDTLVLLLEA
jgi:hypothetical protein